MPREEGIGSTATAGARFCTGSTTGCGTWNAGRAGGAVGPKLLRSWKTAGAGTRREGRGSASRALNGSEAFILAKRLNDGGLDARNLSGQPAFVAS